MNETTAAGTGTATNDAGGPNTTDVTNTTASTQAPADTTAATTATAQTTAEPAVPESYDLQMPDGMELDTVVADEFSAIAKEMKLDQPTAQKFADLGAKMVQRQQEAHAKTVEGWVESVKTDKEIGGDKLTENLAVARKALDTFGTPELRDLLNSSGLGNHPDVIKAFYKVGKAISDDRFVTGSPTTGPIDTAKKMFPEMN